MRRGRRVGGDGREGGMSVENRVFSVVLHRVWCGGAPTIGTHSKGDRD